jgi:hypothetical protein
MLIVLRGPSDRAFKAGRLLSDPIMKLKVDCPRIQVYFHVSQVCLVGQYMSYASSSIYPLGVDQELLDT